VGLVKVIATLIWYDESPAWLASTVASVAKLCDHVLAVDGPYALFPGALRRPSSGPEQADAITRTAEAVGIGSTIHVPTEPWWENEVGKRNFLFGLGERIATSDDWYLLIDADEVLTDVPGDTRAKLEATDHDVAEVFLWEKPDPKAQAVSGAPTLSNHPIRRLYRALPDLVIGPQHHQLRGTKDGQEIYVSDAAKIHPLALPLKLWDVKIEHRNIYRDPGRVEKKRTYYRKREELGIERGEE
jgi:hypothetical protein